MESVRTRTASKLLDCPRSIAAVLTSGAFSGQDRWLTG